MSLASKLVQIKEETDNAERRSLELRETIQQMRDEGYIQAQELGEAQRKLKLKKMELSKIQNLLDGIQGRYSGLQQNKNDAEVANSQLGDVEDQRQDLLNEAKITKENIYDLDSQIKQLESKKKVLQSNIIKSQGRLELLTDKRDTLSVKIDEFSRQIDQADNDPDLNFSEEDLLARIRELDAEILQVSVERENYQRKVTSLSSTQNKVNRQIELTNKELNEIEAEMNAFNSLA